jgi:hypothetical protein
MNQSNNNLEDLEIARRIKAIAVAANESVDQVLLLAEWGCKKYNRMGWRVDQPHPQYLDEYTFEDEKFADLPEWAAPILSQKSKLERVIWSDGSTIIRLKNSNRAVVATEEEWK